MHFSFALVNVTMFLKNIYYSEICKGKIRSSKHGYLLMMVRSSLCGVSQLPGYTSCTIRVVGVVKWVAGLCPLCVWLRLGGPQVISVSFLWVY